MTDLMHGLIQVKDPLTLFAFISLVFLVAFRTKKVPELFFDIAKEKLTRERFYQLIHRFMVYGFTAFALLCASAIAGQVLALKTQAKPITLDDLRAELARSKVSDSQKDSALDSYSKGIAYIQQHDFDTAIASLQNSISQVPTLAAEYTLAYLYQKKGDAENTKVHAANAHSSAAKTGESLGELRIERLTSSSGGSAATGTGGWVGDKKPLPDGGKTPEEASWISPGMYVLNSNLSYNEYRYYKIRLKKGQTLVVEMKTSDTGNYAGASIYDADAVVKNENRIVASRSTIATTRWSVPADTVSYVAIGGYFGASANSFYHISIE